MLSHPEAAATSLLLSSCLLNASSDSEALLQAISLDFLGVPGSEVASKTADLIEKHVFPQDKRLGAGVVDGRSVWADGETPSALVAALQAKVSAALFGMIDTIHVAI